MGKPMKVVQQTLTVLTLRERPLGIWLLGSFTAAMGLLIFLSSNSQIDWFGLVCVVCADLMILASPVKIYHFDKQRHRLIFHQKGGLGRQLLTYPMDDRIEVQVESMTLFGLKFYRLRLKLFSQQPFYLTIPSTDYQLQRQLAHSIQQFLSS